MDQIRFQKACDKIIDTKRERQGIGTLGEKTVHAILKNYLEPREEYHEIRVNGYVADIRNEERIIEIQTRGFHALRKKLEVFLELAPVTIVYPVPHIKWLRWIEEETGEISDRRKSPKMGTPYMIFYELYKIKSFLRHPNLSFCIVLLDVEEYRFLNGWSQDKKKGSSRYDRIPKKIVEEVWIRVLEDYKKMLPETLEETFTSKDYKNKTKLTLSQAQTALNVLLSVDAIERVGKKDRAYVYQRK